MRKITGIIVHHSESDIKAHDNISVIREWHTSPKKKGGRGWKDIGYHYFVRKDGTVQKGRDVSKVGAHCRGHNTGTVGICVSGDTKFTRHQFNALASLITRLKIGLEVDLTIEPHSKYSKKECPKFSIEKFKEDYL